MRLRSTRRPLGALVRRLVVLALCLGFTGCFQTTLIFDDRPAEVWPEKTESKLQALGLVPIAGPVRLDICDAGVARIEQVKGGLSILLEVFVRNLVTMREVTIYCVEGTAKAGWLDEDGRLHSDEAVQFMKLVSWHTDAS